MCELTENTRAVAKAILAAARAPRDPSIDGGRYRKLAARDRIMRLLAEAPDGAPFERFLRRHRNRRGVKFAKNLTKYAVPEPRRMEAEDIALFSAHQLAPGVRCKPDIAPFPRPLLAPSPLRGATRALAASDCSAWAPSPLGCLRLTCCSIPAVRGHHHRLDRLQPAHGSIPLCCYPDSRLAAAASTPSRGQSSRPLSAEALPASTGATDGPRRR
jgi:hypothetical protein